jgi:DNA modification methylase
MLEVRPIVCTPDGVVLGGNMRLRACKEAGLREVPVHVVSWLDSQQEEFIIKDNVGYGEWDWDILANEWDANQLEDWGLDVWTPEAEPEEGLTDPDEVPQTPEEPKTQPGDLYILGNHRLLCGDSTNAEHVARLMHGQKADALITDPPYGIKIGSQTQGKGGGVAKKIDYGKNDWDNEIPKTAILELMQHASEIVLWGANYYTDILPPSPCWIVWDKDNGNTDFADFEMAWTNQKKSSRMLKYTWAGMRQEDMKNKEKRVHPTQKPVGVIEWILNKFKFGDCVLDGFSGSGSTLIAAEKTGRTCYAMELDPKYCDVIVKRWEDFTGKKAELVS